MRSAGVVIKAAFRHSLASMAELSIYLAAK